MSELTKTELYDRMERLFEAEEKLEEVIEIVSGAISGLGCEAWADAYVLSWLKILAGPHHGYISRDPGLYDIRAKIEKDLEEMREEELHIA